MVSIALIATACHSKPIDSEFSGYLKIVKMTKYFQAMGVQQGLVLDTRLTSRSQEVPGAEEAHPSALELR